MGVYSDFRGSFGEQLYSGRCFLYHVPAQALLLSATTGGHPTLFNPASSGKAFIPACLRISFVSGATTIGSVLIAETLNAGSQAATGSAILTATLVAAKNAFRGATTGNTSVMQWAPTTNTFTAAPTVIAAAGLNLGASAPTGTGTYETWFDGTLAFAPGSAMSIVYSVTTSTSLWQITLLGMEVPLPVN